MQLSRKFVSEYVDIPKDIDIKTLALKLTDVGNEFDEAKKLIDATNLVIGEIIECIPHPDSDHLHVCKVNIGTEILQIVCGAPNARSGIKVIVALVGAKLPGGIIKKGTIRGIESNGMLCSIEELGLDHKFLNPEDIEGIKELDQDAVVGEDPIKYLELDDEIIDFDLTSNRGDLLSILGMAYEIGAIYDKKVKDIDLSYKEINQDINSHFNVDVRTDNCSLFLAKKALNVEIKESPKFIKNRLIASGIRPINNVVDISNYVMLETGQPLHFYDADHLGDTLCVRMADENEKLVTLDQQERNLSKDDIVIADKTHAIGLAGVMGGLSTEVEDTTKNIIIESAIFNATLVRRTSNRILRSEASNRFEKGLDPNRTYMAINRAAHLLEKYASAQIEKGIVTYDKTSKEEKIVDITVKNINDVLGTYLQMNEIIDIFRRLGFKTTIDKEIIKVNVPTRRLDISIKEDLIEEVGRIYGVNNIKGKLPITTMKKGSYDKTTREIRNKMISLGLNEVLSYILVSKDDVYKFTNDVFEDVKLLDPLTEERSTLRYSMIPSLMKIFEYNKKRNIKDISIFEIGKGFYKKETYGENNKLCCLMYGNYYLGINHTQKVDFYIIKGVVEEILDYLGYANRYSFIDDNIPKELHPKSSATILVGKEEIGIIGKVHPSIIKEDVYVFEINLDKLLAIKTSKMKYKEISKYPSVTKDLAFVVNKKITCEKIMKTIKKSGGKLLKEIKVFDVYTGENVDADEKSLAFSLVFEDSTKTLNDDEVMEIFNLIISNVEKEHNAKLRDK